MNIERAKQRVEAVLGGCKCKTGCGTRRCGCRKNGRFCGPGCQCIGCTNVPTASTSSSRSEDCDLQEVVLEDMRRAEDDQQQQNSETESEDGEESDTLLNNDSETDEIMARVFGHSDSESDHDIL